MKHLVPNIIKYSGVVQITGEVVAPSSVTNSRNFASGSLGLKGLKGLEEFMQRPLVFVAYDSSNLYDNYSEEMNWLRHGCGFNVVTLFDCTRYPTDGTVYKLWDGNKFRDLGHTAKHPRGAFALKEQATGVETTLLDVVWQIGKSGVVSPVAVLSPITIGDAVVARATLHNIEYIRDLNLEIGCSVEVIRSGEIIPRVVRRID
jgi:DNA ligase (NAD+)